MQYSLTVSNVHLSHVLNERRQTHVQRMRLPQQPKQVFGPGLTSSVVRQAPAGRLVFGMDLETPSLK